jgi:hypothetical protein
MIQRTRILMSAADEGGASAAPSPVVETQPELAALQPAVPAHVVDPDAIAAKVRDSLFAELRKAGVFEKQKAAPAAKPAESSTQSQPDLAKLRRLDRGVVESGLSGRIPDAAYQRAERDFVADDPADVTSWLRDYFPGLGGSSTPQPAVTAPQAPAPKPQNAQPVSDRGAPPPSQVPLAEADLVTMSESDRAHLIKEKGLRWYKDHLAGQLKGRRMLLR